MEFFHWPLLPIQFGRTHPLFNFKIKSVFCASNEGHYVNLEDPAISGDIFFEPGGNLVPHCEECSEKVQ